MISFLYIVPMFFIGLFAQMLPNNPILPFIKVLPTYYIASGISDAVTNQSTIAGVLLNVSVIGGSTVLLFVFSVWILRRQATVAASI